MNAAPPKASRVVVALDLADDWNFALELARYVALTSTTELLGLFVENTRILEHAQSRVAREVMLTGRERPLERTALERQMRAQSAQMRASFEAAASRLGFPHAFQVARGEIGAEWVQCAGEAEALVVGLAKEFRRTSEWLGAALRRLFEAPLPLVLLAREGWRSGRSIAVVVEDADMAERVLQTAARFATHSNSPITLLLAGAASQEHERARVVRALQTRGIELGDIVVLKSYGALSIVHAALECRARLLVLPAPASGSDGDLIEELLRKLPSALLLVRR